VSRWSSVVPYGDDCYEREERMEWESGEESWESVRSLVGRGWGERGWRGRMGLGGLKGEVDSCRRRFGENERWSVRLVYNNSFS